MMMEEKKDSICIKLAETDEELCGRPCSGERR